MKELYELGIVFRGSILVNHIHQEIPGKIKKETHKDLRGSFISAISSIINNIYNNSNFLEYLETKEFLFIFKASNIKKAKDNISKKEEPLIIYALIKKIKKVEKLVKIYSNKLENLLNLFIEKYSALNFSTELYKIRDFEFEFLTI